MKLNWIASRLRQNSSWFIMRPILYSLFLVCPNNSQLADEKLPSLDALLLFPIRRLPPFPVTEIRRIKRLKLKTHFSSFLWLNELSHLSSCRVQQQQTLRRARLPSQLIPCMFWWFTRAFNRFHTETHSPTILSTQKARLSQSVRTEFTVQDKEGLRQQFKDFFIFHDNFPWLTA